MNMHPPSLKLKCAVPLNLVYVLLETLANGAVKEVTEVGCEERLARCSV